jgi:hypothetical protein
MAQVMPSHSNKYSKWPLPNGKAPCCSAGNL